MYKAYQEWCVTKGYEQVKEYFYRLVFNTEFNLHFHVPRKDTCKNCDRYKQLIQVETDEETKRKLEEHNTHLDNAEKARENLRKDTLRAKNMDDFYLITVDLQKALLFPTLTVSEAYYRRNMYCYNFGVHDCAKDLAYMYVWDEVEGSRGSQEIATCLRKHLQYAVRPNVKQVVIYSDACTGQNRNIKLSLSLSLSDEMHRHRGNLSRFDRSQVHGFRSFLPSQRCGFWCY